jgi:hypothetical protein
MIDSPQKYIFQVDEQGYNHHKLTNKHKLKKMQSFWSEVQVNNIAAITFQKMNNLTTW